MRFPTEPNLLISNKSTKGKQGKKNLLQEDRSPYMLSHITTKQI